MNNYHQDYQPPPGPPPGHRPYDHNSCLPLNGSYGSQANNSYFPHIGFTRLPASFYIWNVFESNTSCLELGPQLKGPVAYSAKMFSSSRLKVKEGPWVSGQSPVCTIEARHPFSQKSTITFDGFQSKIKEKSQWHEGVAWPFDVSVNGRSQRWEWRKKKSNGSSTLKQFLGSVSERKLGTWELVSAGGRGQCAATFRAEGGNTFERDAALGYFEFQGPAANGGLGISLRT